jgi:hypothetical protein
MAGMTEWEPSTVKGAAFDGSLVNCGDSRTVGQQLM